MSDVPLSGAELSTRGYTKITDDDILVPEGSLYHCIILGSHLVKEKGKKAFTSYRIRVFVADGKTWDTFRRYSEFHSLKESIKSQFPEIEISRKFPPKKILGNMTPELIDLRHQNIQSWFREVLRHPEVGHSALIEWFVSDEKYQINEEEILEASDGGIYLKLELGKMGYLFVLRKGRFKKKWCVLRNNILYKYKSHVEKHPSGQFVFITCDVTEVEFQEPGEIDLFCFMVKTEKEKLIFATETEQDTEEWVDCLAAATYPLETE